MCILTATLLTTATAGLAGAVGAAGTAATTMIGTVVGAGLAAVDGAIMGAIGAGISGGDVGKGALMGAAGGAVTGGIMGGIGAATSAASVTPTAAQGPGGGGIANATPGASGNSSGDFDWAGLAKGGIQATGQLAGATVEAIGAQQQAADTAAALKAQAESQKLQAQSEIDSAMVEAKDLARRQRLQIGKGKVAAAANGVMLESDRAESSPAMWEQDMQAEAAWDREKLFYNANQRAQLYIHNANQSLVAAKNAKRSGNLKATSAFIKGGINAATSLGTAYFS